MEYTSRDPITGFETALNNDTPSARQRIINAYEAMIKSYDQARNYTQPVALSDTCARNWPTTMQR